LIPDRIAVQLEEVASYVGDCDDWVTIKKEVMRGIPPALRKNFSTRHPKSKEQWLNPFEMQLIENYEKLTGITLVLRTLAERRELFGIL
jgi:hypothetical protein